jgi:hypothetical protein
MILFVASDVQGILNDRSVFNGWIEYLIPKDNYLLVDHVFVNHYLDSSKFTKVVALGSLAGLALSHKNVEFFKIHNPSCNLTTPIDYTVQVEAVLEECKKYLNS